MPADPVVTIALERADQPDVVRLIDALDAYQRPLYPAASHHGIGVQALVQPNVLFAVARINTGAAVGCGAVVLESARGELKRMFVLPAFRGTGVARALLAFLELQARAKGCALFVLETGIRQPEALAFYARAGYVRCDPFGDYTHDPNSVFMQKASP